MSIAYIWKWQLRLAEVQTIDVPMATEFLTAASMVDRDGQDRIWIWGRFAWEMPGYPVVTHRAEIHMSVDGNCPTNQALAWRHVATVVTPGVFVWHLFIQPMSDWKRIPDER